MRALFLQPGRFALLRLVVLALAGLTLVALAASEAPTRGGDRPPPAGVVVG
ncbi:MAG: hypothetical protein ACLFU0_11385 [Alphaproteobacteria bacterium]